MSELLRLGSAMLITFESAGIGLLIGIVFAIGLALVRQGDGWGWLGDLVAVAVKSTPAFAIPLALQVSGSLGKVLVAAAICFFPIYIEVHEALRTTPEGLTELRRTFGGSEWRGRWLAERGWLIARLFLGIKAAVPLAVVGAVVAEFVTSAGSTEFGLGVLMYTARNVAIELWKGTIATTLLGLALYATTDIALRYVRRMYRLNA